MTRLPVVGSDSDNWGALLNEYLQVSHRENGSTKHTLEVFNVQDYGAAGDGRADDTEAVRRTISAAESSPHGGTIYFPSGKYRITDTLSFTVQKIVEIRGNGCSSEILWAFDGHLFKWISGILCREVTMSDLRITSVDAVKSAASAAILCDGGVERSYFDHLMITSSFEKFPESKIHLGSGIVFNGVSDSTAIHQCQFWGITGTGIRVGHGSEIRIEGGRIIGTAARNDRSIGLHLTGNNGGVHIVTMDLIGLDEGARIEDLGKGSNREVFFTHATLDSCRVGLLLKDSTIVSITGCWAASCNEANILVEGGDQPNLVINGGNIFNAGAWAKDDPHAGKHGIVVKVGSFMLTGVSVRANEGIGVWVPDDAMRDYMITNCRITDNGQGINLHGARYMLANNILTRNKAPNQIEGADFVDANNLQH